MGMSEIVLSADMILEEFRFLLLNKRISAACIYSLFFRFL